MATNYISTHSGSEIDNLQAQINALNTTLSNLNNSIASTYVNKSTFNTLSNTVSSVQSNYATKAQINNVTVCYSTSSSDITLTNSAKKTAWTVAISGWTAPSNGWLRAYFNNTSGTPAAFIRGENNEVRQSAGNATREFCLHMPVIAGKTYEIQYIYCGVCWARFNPNEQLN